MDLDSTYVKVLEQVQSEYNKAIDEAVSLAGELTVPDVHFPFTTGIGKLYHRTHGDYIGPALIPVLPVTLIYTNGTGAVGSLFQNIAFSLYQEVGPGRCRLRYIDLNSFGGAAKSLNRLSSLIMSGVEIDSEKKVYQFLDETEQYIRNVNKTKLALYNDIIAYNRANPDGQIPYYCVFICDFPRGLSADQKRRFESLMTQSHAANAGIFFFATTSYEEERTNEFISRLQDGQGIKPIAGSSRYVLKYELYGKGIEDDYTVQLDTELPDNIESVIEAINRDAESHKVQTVSFDQVLQQMIDSGEYWKGNATGGLKVAIGEQADDGGAAKLSEKVYFELGGSTVDYFAMIGGRPGYGKTVLLHDIICGASLEYSPLELNFYLIDCTNGTGFKPYENLPHATFVSTTREREFTVSALERLVQEMYFRAEAFKDAGDRLQIPIEKIEEYRRRTGNAMPRILMIIDEFQVLLEKGDSLSRQATGLLEKLVREGRKYGINAILCTQSFRNVNIDTELITLRIAFNLKESDSWKILGANNDAAVKLKKKGEAILNNQNGALEANILFQAAFTDKMNHYVRFCQKKAEEHGVAPETRFVFDGTLTAAWPPYPMKVAQHDDKVYLGVPAFLRAEHSYFRLSRNPGSNLLITGADKLSAIRIIMLADIQITDSIIHFIDFSNSDDEIRKSSKVWCDRMPNINYCEKNDLAELADGLEKELEERLENDRTGKGNAGRVRIIVNLFYLQNARELKKEGFQIQPVTAKLIKVLKYGPDCSIHLMVYSYNYKGLFDIFDQSLMSEFGSKVILRSGSGPSFCPDCDSESLPAGRGLLITADRSTTYAADPVVLYDHIKDNDVLMNSPAVLQIFELK